ncbi:PAS domain-containing protein [Desertivirga arenae]|uniref:PAS domain-containing protein n=1 Tax=Desertivirga arenae TaxID=2810309 RepID=UPI001A95C2FF|nr:PAS domain S-box protein [Pedobacter sp. SYSU D00823]
MERTKADAADQINRTLVENVRLSALADKINSLVMITDNTGKILWVNSTFERFTGYSLIEVAGKYPNFLHGPNTDVSVQDKINQEIIKSDFVRGEIINYTKGGEEYWVELNISAIYDDSCKVSQYISISNIITERKRNEAIIERQKEAFRQVAWANSHSLRRPVASILSLARLSEECIEADELREIHSLLKISADELDIELRKLSKDINQLESDIDTIGE